MGEEGVQTKKQKGQITISLEHKKQMRIVVAEVRKLANPNDASAQKNSATCKVMWKNSLIGQTNEVDCKGRCAEWDDATFFIADADLQKA